MLDLILYLSMVCVTSRKSLCDMSSQNIVLILCFIAFWVALDVQRASGKAVYELAYVYSELPADMEGCEQCGAIIRTPRRQRTATYVQRERRPGGRRYQK